MKGKGYDEFFRYISSSEKLIYIIDNCLYTNIPKDKRNLGSDLKKIYDAVYNQNQENWNLQVGNIEINKYDVEYYNDLCTMLSDFLMPENNNE